MSDAEADWVVYMTEVAPDAGVTLHDEEHDKFEWVPLAEALVRCQPQIVADGVALAARNLGDSVR